MKFDLSRLPTPEEIRAAREAANLTQEQAAAIVHRSDRKRWNEWEQNKRQMQLDTWELFLRKTNQL